MIYYIVAVLRDQDSQVLGTGQAEEEVSFSSEDIVFVCFSPPWGGGGLAAEVPQRGAGLYCHCS